MRLQFAIFISIVLSVLSLASFYVGHFIITRSPWAQGHRGLIWLSLGIFLVLEVLGPVLYRSHPDPTRLHILLQWITYTAMGTFACFFFYALFSDLFVFLWKIVIRPEEAVNLERRGFLAAVGLTLVSLAGGLYQAFSGPRLYEVEIPLENLPEEFEGFRIVQITDLHAGPIIGRDYVSEVVKSANGLHPDLVALTGDFVDGTVKDLEMAVEPLRELKAPHGLFFVTGNHEYYWGAQEWVDQYKTMGIRVLQNEHVLIRKGQSQILLAGVTDHSAGRILPSHASDPAKAALGAPENTVKILLAHQPASYKEASRAGYDLQLSGHTHAGQFFPWSLVVMAAQRYYKGLNRHEKMWVYVSRGTGYWGPPLRFGIPSEITLIKLKRLA